MFYIVDKLKEQAKRWKLKAGQSAVSMFYIVGRRREQVINLNL